MREWRLKVIFLAMLVPVSAAGAPETNFSQHPGFDRYFADNPPSSDTPGAAERALLKRYRPRILVPENQPGPIDFYRDYIARGSLYDGGGKLVSEAVVQALLNRHEGDPKAEFRHLPPASGNSSPVIYARFDVARVGNPDGGEADWRRYQSTEVRGEAPTRPPGRWFFRTTCAAFETASADAACAVGCRQRGLIQVKVTVLRARKSGLLAIQPPGLRRYHVKFSLLHSGSGVAPIPRSGFQ